MVKSSIIIETLKALKINNGALEAIEAHNLAAPQLSLPAFELLLAELVKQKLVLRHKELIGTELRPIEQKDKRTTGHIQYRVAKYRITYHITAEGFTYLRFTNFRLLYKVWVVFNRKISKQLLAMALLASATVPHRLVPLRTGSLLSNNR